MGDNGKNRVRYTLYAAAGFYLIYLAYGLFKQLKNGAGNEKMIMIIAMVVFAAAGAAIAVMGLKKGFLAGQDGYMEEEELSENAPDSQENASDVKKENDK